MLSATPPIAAGATSFTKLPAICAMTVLTNDTFSVTNPSRLIAAAMYVSPEKPTATSTHIHWALLTRSLKLKWVSWDSSR